jgi:bile acid:Na+ symporter, BASS family
MSHIASLAGSVATVVMILFLITVMLSIGLEVTVGECLAAIRNRRLLLSALVANFVLVPLLGLGIARILPMPPAIETGFLLLAAAPGAVFAINFTRAMRDSVPTAAALLFLLTVLSIGVTPPLARFLTGVKQPVALHYEEHARALVLYVISPLLVGFALNRWDHDLARVLRKPASTCAGIFFAAGAVLMLSVRSAATKKIGANAILAVLLLIVGSMIVGWIMGGPNRGTRRVMAVNTSMRNVALCLAIAARSFPGTDVEVEVVAFSALMLPPNLLFTIYQGRKIKKEAALAARRDGSEYFHRTTLS